MRPSTTPFDEDQFKLYATYRRHVARGPAYYILNNGMIYAAIYVGILCALDLIFSHQFLQSHHWMGRMYRLIFSALVLCLSFGMAALNYYFIQRRLAEVS